MRIFLFALLVTAGLHAQEPYLGPPPTAPTDIIPLEPLASGALAESAPGAITGFLDTTDREAVRMFYKSTWVPNRTATIGWTGDAGTCMEGTISQGWKDAFITSLNYLRAMAGVPSAVTLDAANSAKSQKGALMFSVNKQLSHTPPTTWTCYSADGAAAAASSNICLQSFNVNPGCLELFMDDFGSTNTSAGHRRWFLYPQTQTFGLGDVPAIGGNSAGDDVWVFDGRFGTARPFTRERYVAWPSPGYFPYQLTSNRWSFSYPSATFDGASVTMTKDGVNVPVSLEAVQNGFGENTIVFFPTSADTAHVTIPVKPTSDTTYTITITNVVISGAPQTFTYNVIVFDPATASGSMAQVATAGGWDTLITLVNLGAGSDSAHADFYSNSGGPLTIPLNLVPAASAISAGLTTTPTPASSFDQPLNPNASAVIDATGDVSQAQVIGWSQLQSAGSISGFGIFRFPQFKWEAVVPLETRSGGSYLLAFDNTGVLATGVAVANVSGNAANITVIIRDDNGVVLSTQTLTLPGRGHDSFMLNVKYPATAAKRGTIEFQTPAGGQISVLGLRANGGALTTLPVLAGVTNAGGSITHATYNGGFTSVFFIVNTGASSASFTLSFFGENGSPLTVPLSLPQTGTTTTTSALTRTLAAGALLVVETQAQDAAATVSGSAQLTTTGNISGFEIFRWTTFGQEASVPVETRAPNSFVLVFDDTGVLTTGIALANLNAAAASVTVKIYDETGALLETANIDLPARGHTSFMLPGSFASTVGRRGMVEFVVPAGGKISAVGLRAKADGTLTTIPVLTK